MLLANYANTVNRADATATMPIISAMNVTPHKFQTYSMHMLFVKEIHVFQEGEGDCAKNFSFIYSSRPQLHSIGKTCTLCSWLEY